MTFEAESPYPEHEKLKRIQPLSQAIGEFLDWCGDRGIALAENTPDMDDRLWFIETPIEKLMAEHFGIDLQVIEQEKRAMLES